jgi:hypothetical protein
MILPFGTLGINIVAARAGIGVEMPASVLVGMELPATVEVGVKMPASVLVGVEMPASVLQRETDLEGVVARFNHTWIRRAVVESKRTLQGMWDQAGEGKYST